MKGLAPQMVYILLFALLLPESPAAVERTAPSQQPQRTAVFVSGTGGYHTYRIPALLVTKKGTLLAFCEECKKSRGDRRDMTVRVSYDEGKTWPVARLLYAVPIGVFLPDGTARWRYRLLIRSRPKASL